MKLSILIGGKAGQGINKISEIVSDVLAEQGYYTFNYRDYPSLIRGGHNFNILTISNIKIGSNESILSGILALDENTMKIHKFKLRKSGFILSYKPFEDLGRNTNLALAGALIKILGIPKKILIDKINKEFNNEEAIQAAEKGFNSQEQRYSFDRLGNKISILSGSQAIAQGAINSNLDLYFAYPMTPATGVMHELAANQLDNNLVVFQSENEIATANHALGASFAGAKTMIGTSGGGFDLMGETLSLQGMSEIPLTVYLASRPGPGTGIPTYSSQADLDIALRAGHGEFPRIVVAPGDPIEAIESTNQSLYLAEKFKTLSIILGDKHLAESEFSFNEKSKPKKSQQIKIQRDIPGKNIIKASSYEHDKYGNTSESTELARKNADYRLKKYKQIKRACKSFDMIKIHGNKKSKNLIIGWGSTKGQILDAIQGLDCKFLQILYLKPLSDKIKSEMQKAENIILIEQNVTGQLGRLLREKTGILIKKKNRILKYDGLPFYSDELKKEIEKRLK